jgi:hypothetical protein
MIKVQSLCTWNVSQCTFRLMCMNTMCQNFPPHIVSKNEWMCNLISFSVPLKVMVRNIRLSSAFFRAWKIFTYFHCGPLPNCWETPSYVSLVEVCWNVTSAEHLFILVLSRLMLCWYRKISYSHFIPHPPPFNTFITSSTTEVCTSDVKPLVGSVRSPQHVGAFPIVINV